MVSSPIFKKAVSLGFFVFSLIFLLSFRQAIAQVTPPQFFVSWKVAGSYIPSFYQGKALPTYGTPITASFEIVSGGKIVNVHSQTVYWYLNDNLIGSGTGLQQVTFQPTGQAPNSLVLKVELPDYPSGIAIHTIQIPMVLPVAVIYAPYPNGTFSQNPLTLNAFPYFFKISDASDLSYKWTVNGQTGANAENPEEAQISLPQDAQSGATIAVSLNVQNPNDSTAAAASENLIYQSQL
jgi:hypothetical protein